MSLLDITDEQTLRFYRREAKQLGHRMSRLRTYSTTAVASCHNNGCAVMVEISGRNFQYQFIDLKGDSISATDYCKGERT